VALPFCARSHQEGLAQNGRSHPSINVNSKTLKCSSSTISPGDACPQGKEKLMSRRKVEFEYLELKIVKYQFFPRIFVLEN